MPHKPDLPCAGCGTLMWRGNTSLPAGLATCLPCRRARRAAQRQPLPVRPCKKCSRMFEPKQRTHVYCTVECRPRRGGAGAGRTRGTTPARGYGYAHQKLRAGWAVVVEAGDADCSLCGDPIPPGAEWDLDHTPDRTGYRGPAHRSCNRADGAARTNRRLVGAL